MEAFNYKEQSGALFFDISKAFDKVWGRGLLWKMIQADFKVQISDRLSTEINAEAGVPQGSVLAPLLYTLFTRDVPRTDHTRLYLYADDCENKITGDIA